MHLTRSGVLAAMVMAVSLVTMGGTASAEPSGAMPGTAADAEQKAQNNEAQATDMQPGATQQPSTQPNAMDQSANQQSTQHDKASQADLEQGKTAKAVDDLEQQKPSN